MSISRFTHAALSSLDRLQNGEDIIDGAPARCKELDERYMASFEEIAGGIAGVRLWAKQHGVPSLSLMEADLVVTTRALCYVAYHLHMATIAEWEVLSGVETAKPKLFGATGRLTVVYQTGFRRNFQVSRGALEPIARLVLQHLS